MKDSEQRTRLLAGVFVLCGLVLLGGLILEFGSLRHKLRGPYRIEVNFMDAQNLIKGAPVKRAGANIGQVATSPKLVEGLRGVMVELDIYKEFQIPKTSPMRIVAIGLLGDCMIDVGMPREQTGEFLKPGDSVTGEVTMDLQSTANKLTDEIMIVVKDLRDGLAGLNVSVKRLNDGVLSEANTANFSGSLKSLKESIEKVDNEVLSENNTAALRDSLGGFKETMTRINNASGRAESALAKFDKAMDSLEPGLKEVGSAGTSLKSAAASMSALVKDAREGDGLLNALLNDEKLRDSVIAFVSNLKERGLLWYKDKPAEKASAAPPAAAAKPKPWGKR